MCSSHWTGYERTCESRSKISAHCGSSSLKLRKVPTVPWQDPLARKTVSPFRNVSARKMSSDCRPWKRCMFFRPFRQETSGTDGSADRKNSRSPLGEGCRFKYTAFMQPLQPKINSKPSLRRPDGCHFPLTPFLAPHAFAAA